MLYSSYLYDKRDRRRPLHSGDRLASAMDDKGITISRLSRETGLSRATIRNMRVGDKRGSMYSWALVAKALGMRIDELIGGSDGR